MKDFLDIDWSKSQKFRIFVPPIPQGFQLDYQRGIFMYNKPIPTFYFDLQ